MFNHFRCYSIYSRCLTRFRVIKGWLQLLDAKWVYIFLAFICNHFHFLFHFFAFAFFFVCWFTILDKLVCHIILCHRGNSGLFVAFYVQFVDGWSGFHAVVGQVCVDYHFFPSFWFCFGNGLHECFTELDSFLCKWICFISIHISLI